MSKLHSSSEEETRAFGFALGRQLPVNSIVCFFGDLGAGKTTFIKGLAAGASGIQPEEIQSPTFTYLHIYNGNPIIYHFDLYRLHDANEFLSMGFDEYLFADGICCVEWSEKIAPLLPAHSVQVHLDHNGEQRREITVKGSAEYPFKSL